MLEKIIFCVEALIEMLLIDKYKQAPGLGQLFEVNKQSSIGVFLYGSVTFVSLTLGMYIFMFL